jgi:hypothetical protein
MAKKECKGFTGASWDERSEEWDPYDVNCMCVHCKYWNPESKDRLINFIGWSGESEHCDVYKSKKN